MHTPTPESAHPPTSPISSEFVLALVKKALFEQESQQKTESHYPDELSDIAKVYLLDLEATFRGIKEEIARTGKTDGYLVTDILMTINDQLISQSEYEYLIRYAWYMCVLNDINMNIDRPQPRHLKQPRHRYSMLDDIADLPPFIEG